MNTSPPIEQLTVAHVDHSVERGGAELALQRMVLRARWNAYIFLPRGPSTGPFNRVDEGRIVRSGPAQPPRQIVGNGLRGTSFLLLISRTVASAIALVINREFRRCDIVHANTTRAALYALPAALLLRKPIIVHLRDRAEPDALGRVGALLLKICSSAADGLIANSPSTLGTVKPGRGAQVAIIRSHIGVDVMDTPRHRRPEDSGPVVIGMVARLDPWKGQDLVVRAVALAEQLLKRQLRLVLVGGTSFGSDAYAQKIRESAESAGIMERVALVGHVQDVVPLIDSFDVCIQASVRPEPMGQNVLQYLARGRPTVVADQGGPSEIVAHEFSGLHHQTGSAEDLARAIARLVADPGFAAKLGTQAAIQAASQSDSQLDREYETFLSSLASSTLRRSGERP